MCQKAMNMITKHLSTCLSRDCYNALIYDIVEYDWFG